LKTVNMSTPRTATASNPAVWEKALLIAEASPVRLSSTELRATVVTAEAWAESPTPSTTAAGKKLVQ
jgi:hypothetical protein